MKRSRTLEIVSNLHPQKIGLKVRRKGPQPSIFVRSFSPITSLPSDNRWLSAHVDPGQYDALYERRRDWGEDIHGEVNFLLSLVASTSFSLLDAGCGTGRIAIEAARRGVHVVGVDLDPQMLARASEKAPGLEWKLGDLETLSLGRVFDLVLLAGNVMICLTPGSERAVLANLVTHLVPGGLLVAGFATDRDYYTLTQYDETLNALGLLQEGRWATWEREAWATQAPFAISVHRKPKPIEECT